MSNVTIRYARRDDQERLRGIMLQYIVGFYHSPQPSDQALNDLIISLIDNPSQGVQLIAESEPGELLGFATMYFSFNTLEMKRMAILHDLFVMPSSRGKKVGESLFKACLQFVRENNLSHMFWETEHNNHTAQALYDKMGATRQRWLNYEIK